MLRFALALAAVTTSGCVMARVEADPSEIAVGERAPDFVLTSARGAVVDSAEVRAQGDSLLVVFYRTRW
jgi:hypothetical protein